MHFHNGKFSNLGAIFLSYYLRHNTIPAPVWKFGIFICVGLRVVAGTRAVHLHLNAPDISLTRLDEIAICRLIMSFVANETADIATSLNEFLPPLFTPFALLS